MTPEPPSRVLEGQVAVVTGAGQGVGAGIARALAHAGAAAVIATRRAATGEPVAESIRAAGHEAVFVRCDVTAPGDVQAAVAEAVERFGGLDVMVHNAVSPPGPSGPVQLTGSDTIRAQIATSTTATFRCARASLEHLRRRPGTMILLTSPAGVEGSANLPVYATVKAAQRGILKSLAREWGPEGVRVNAIAPVARTPAMDAAVAVNPAWRSVSSHEPRSAAWATRPPTSDRWRCSWHPAAPATSPARPSWPMAEDSWGCSAPR